MTELKIPQGALGGKKLEISEGFTTQEDKDPDNPEKLSSLSIKKFTPIVADSSSTPVPVVQDHGLKTDGGLLSRETEDETIDDEEILEEIVAEKVKEAEAEKDVELKVKEPKAKTGGGAPGVKAEGEQASPALNLSTATEMLVFLGLIDSKKAANQVEVDKILAEKNLKMSDIEDGIIWEEAQELCPWMTEEAFDMLSQGGQINKRTGVAKGDGTISKADFEDFIKNHFNPTARHLKSHNGKAKLMERYLKSTSFVSFDPKKAAGTLKENTEGVKDLWTGAGDIKLGRFIESCVNEDVKDLVIQLLINSGKIEKAEDITEDTVLSLQELRGLFVTLNFLMHDSKPSDFIDGAKDLPHLEKDDGEEAFLAALTEGTEHEVEVEEEVAEVGGEGKSKKTKSKPLSKELKGKTDQGKLELALEWEKESKKTQERMEELTPKIKPYIQMSPDGKEIVRDEKGFAVIDERFKGFEVEKGKTVEDLVEEYVELEKSNKNKNTDALAVLQGLEASDDPVVRNKARLELGKFDEIIEDNEASELIKAEAHVSKISQGKMLSQYIENADLKPLEKSKLKAKYAEELSSSAAGLKEAKEILEKLMEKPDDLNEENQATLYQLSTQIALSENNEAKFYKYLKLAAEHGSEKAKEMYDKLNEEYMPGQFEFMTAILNEDITPEELEESYDKWIEALEGDEGEISEEHKEKAIEFLGKVAQQYYFDGYKLAMNDDSSDTAEEIGYYEKALFLIKKYKDLGGKEPLKTEVDKGKFVSVTEEEIAGLIKVIGGKKKGKKIAGTGNVKKKKKKGKTKGKDGTGETGKTAATDPSGKGKSDGLTLKQVKGKVSAIKEKLGNGDNAAAISIARDLVGKSFSETEAKDILSYLESKSKDEKMIAAKKMVRDHLNI